VEVPATHAVDVAEIVVEKVADPVAGERRGGVQLLHLVLEDGQADDKLARVATGRAKLRLGRSAIDARTLFCY
jgi:hypothetical protein